MKKKLTLLLAAVLLISILSACGNSSFSSSATDSVAALAPADMNSSPQYAAAGAASNSGGGWSMSEAFESEKGYPSGDYNNAPLPEPADAPSSSNTFQPLTAGVPENAKLIYTADINLQTTEFDNATAALTDLVTSMGGYFESSSVNNYSSYRYGSYTVRVPAQSFDAFCSQVGQLCQMTYISRSADDVSEYYYDTESRLFTQQTKLTRLEELLARADSMEDIITIESAISETELAIEQLTGTLRHYDSLVGYSTVYISLDEVYRLDDVEQPAIGFGAKLAAALKSGCSRFVWDLQNFLLGVASNWVGWLTFIVVAAAVVVLIVRLVKRRRRKRDDADI